MQLMSIYIYIKSAAIYVCSKSASFPSALKKKKDPSHHNLYKNTLEPIICELHDHENRINLSSNTHKIILVEEKSFYHKH